MEYIDQVYVDLKDKKPGRYPLDHLREPERFTSAVKELIDGEWLTNVYFSEDFKTLVIQQPFELIINTITNKTFKKNFYDKQSEKTNEA